MRTEKQIAQLHNKVADLPWLAITLFIIFCFTTYFLNLYK